jgi:hypothetical protein
MIGWVGACLVEILVWSDDLKITYSTVHLFDCLIQVELIVLAKLGLFSLIRAGFIENARLLSAIKVNETLRLPRVRGVLSMRVEIHVETTWLSLRRALFLKLSQESLPCWLRVRINIIGGVWRCSTLLSLLFLSFLLVFWLIPSLREFKFFQYFLRINLSLNL